MRIEDIKDENVRHGYEQWLAGDPTRNPVSAFVAGIAWKAARSDLTRHVAIAADLASEVERLREWLPELSKEEWFLLKWLRKEETSAYGECKGISLNRLANLGLAVIDDRNARHEDYSRVSLTEAGRDFLKWEPKP